MEFVPRTRPQRADVYRRPSVDVRPRAEPTRMLHDIGSAPIRPDEYDIPEPTKFIQQDKPYKGDAGTYHDIIPQKKYVAPVKTETKRTEDESTETVKPIDEIEVTDKEPEVQSQSSTVVATLSQEAKKKHGYRLLYVAAASIFLLGGSVVLQGFLTNRDAETQVKALQTQAENSDSGGLPTDEKPEDKNYIANHKVSPLLARVLSIPSIGVSARVTQVGIDKEGAMLAPSTAYDVGWYTGSSRPGENGAMVIDGHVRGVGGPGIFDKLDTLKAGDEITIERGDGKTFTYVVASTETVSTNNVDMGKLLVSNNTALPGMNLITCAGTYDAKNNQFDKRTIVYTVQK